MGTESNVFDNNNLPEEIKRLKLEIKKLNRQLNLANDNMLKYRSITSAKENLSAVIAAEKSVQEKHLHVIMENSLDIIILLDSSMNFLLSTRSFLKLAGVPSIGFMHHKSFRQVFSLFASDILITRLEDIIGRALETKQIQTSEERFAASRNHVDQQVVPLSIAGAQHYYNTQQDMRDYSISVLPFSYSGETNDGILVIFHDITERKEMEDAIKKALGDAMTASKAKGDFLSNMSHEMRTPMNAIIGMTAIGKKAYGIAEKDIALGKIGDAASHLLGIINDVLDMAKIEADKLELAPVEYDFDDMLQKVTTVVNFRVEEKHQQLIIEIGDSVPHFIVGDDQRLAQVIANLLFNAAKFTPEGGTIGLKITLADEIEGICELRIEVADNGIGISPENLKKLFHAFEQAESGTSREYGGTGLGLVISKRIIELMDGEIWVESEYGRGSRFIFTVKVLRGGLLSDSPESDEQGMDRFEGKKMLLAEDIEINREILIALLDDTDISVDCAENGQEALEMINAAPGKYDIVFMDMQMPKMDGLEATRRIRALPSLRDAGLPIIAMTANVFKDDIEACLEAGMDDHLGKPLDIIKVIEKLHKFL